jgi:hypothetical protein
MKEALCLFQLNKALNAFYFHEGPHCPSLVLHPVLGHRVWGTSLSLTFIFYFLFFGLKNILLHFEGY